MEKTCGVFVFDPSGRVLICHVTNAADNVWSIPKGRADRGEAPIDAAVRELREETGLRVRPDDLFEMGCAKYKNGRVLEAFGYRATSHIDAKLLRCESMVDDENGGFPEVDRYAFEEPYDILNKELVHKTQQQVLRNHIYS
jgi:8-oxo-dGTP pyrophosphatase MutT (NUDIX family)